MVIKVTVELISVRTKETTTLGVMHISNDGFGSNGSGNYDGKVLRKRDFVRVTRTGRVENHQRLSKPIWSLVAKMLDNMGYNK